MTRVVLASRNAKKLVELRRILDPLVPGVEVLGLDAVASYAEPRETECTFDGNALIKARAALAATGLPSLADDSGLCVDALNGMPGVLSARWSGVEKDDRRNNELLLAQLRDVPDERRTAQFRCSVAFCAPDSSPVVRSGVMSGRIIRQMRGEGGFGYDVVFVPDGYDITTAEMDMTLKDELSHRGKSLRAIAPAVAQELART
ncbi:MAG TPA: RdgB/HAM1 family non-canonical purine NTP pyrophosphatase [Nocardioidaceae bacterium]|nr:RdgB/HAM1 family non-canonical purine NTP pyrophosphatase [Nocardioidaceae bacterium]